jgi:hypothetical protein
VGSLQSGGVLGGDDDVTEDDDIVTEDDGVTTKDGDAFFGFDHIEIPMMIKSTTATNTAINIVVDIPISLYTAF